MLLYLYKPEGWFFFNRGKFLSPSWNVWRKCYKMMEIVGDPANPLFEDIAPGDFRFQQAFGQSPSKFKLPAVVCHLVVLHLWDKGATSANCAWQHLGAAALSCLCLLAVTLSEKAVALLRIRKCLYTNLYPLQLVGEGCLPMTQS